MAGKPRDPNAPKVVRKIGPSYLFIILDETKLVEGAKGKEVVKDVVRNPNVIFDAIQNGDKITFARVEVKKQARKASA